MQKSILEKPRSFSDVSKNTKCQDKSILLAALNTHSYHKCNIRFKKGNGNYQHKTGIFKRSCGINTNLDKTEREKRGKNLLFIYNIQNSVSRFHAAEEYKKSIHPSKC